MKILIGLEPKDIIAGNFKHQDIPLVLKISGQHPTVTILDGDNVVGYSVIPQTVVAQIAEAVAQKYWYEDDERPIFGNRKEIFTGWVLTSFDQEKTMYLLWWVLDEIREIQGPLDQASKLAEKELIKYVLAQQKEAA